MSFVAAKWWFNAGWNEYEIGKRIDLYFSDFYGKIKIIYGKRRGTMDKNATIVMKKKLNVTDLAGEKVMVDFESGKYFLIKGVGNDIWDMLQEETTPARIIEQLLSEYDVTEEECTRSVEEFLGKLREFKFID